MSPGMQRHGTARTSRVSPAAGCACLPSSCVTSLSRSASRHEDDGTTVEHCCHRHCRSTSRASRFIKGHAQKIATSTQELESSVRPRYQDKAESRSNKAARTFCKSTAAPFNIVTPLSTKPHTLLRKRSKLVYTIHSSVRPTIARSYSQQQNDRRPWIPPRCRKKRPQDYRCLPVSRCALLSCPVPDPCPCPCPRPRPCPR